MCHEVNVHEVDQPVSTCNGPLFCYKVVKPWKETLLPHKRGQKTITDSSNLIEVSWLLFPWDNCICTYCNYL